MAAELKLIEPSLELRSQYTAMVKELISAGDGNNWYCEPALKNFTEFVHRCLEWEKGRNLLDGWVPASTFWLTRNENVLLGVSSLRHKLNKHLLKFGGHIGYAIRPSQRQKGYGSSILKLTLAEAKRLGLKKVLITCGDSNVASIKIIEKNGGVLMDKCDRDKSAKLTRRYWIKLA